MPAALACAWCMHAVLAAQCHRRLACGCKRPFPCPAPPATPPADMRKAMPRDVAKKSIIPLKKPVRPEDLEFE